MSEKDARLPTVGAVVLTFRRDALAKRNVRQLLGLEHLAELIVVDSDPESRLEFDDISDPRFRYVRMTENIGAVARNEGLVLARSDVIVTLDDDVLELSDGDLELIRARFQDAPSLGALCFRVHGPDDAVINWCHHREPGIWSGSEFSTYEISEGAVAFRMEALARVGTYPRSFFISHEGLDLACRLMNAGFEVKYTPAVTVIHLHASEGRANWRRYYYDTRNQIWVAVRNFPARKALGYLTVGMISTFLYSARDGFLRYWLRAVRDGLFGVRHEWKSRKVLSAEVLRRMKEIDAERPGLAATVRKRLFTRGMRI